MSWKLMSLLAVAVAVVMVVPSCGGKSADTVTLQGSGASFPALLYTRWFADYSKKDPSIRINYQSVGSGKGVRDFISDLTDFGASDAAMKDSEIAQVKEGVVLLPMTAGSIVLAYNLPEVEGLKLSREAYVGILLGKITKWNDPKIAASNPGVTLPDTKVTVVRRSDGSGTTFVFTKHLSAISDEWKNGPGMGKTIQWPGNTLGGAKNDGVTAAIKQTPGAIGYVEYSYAVKGDLAMAWLENKSGEYVEPTPESAQAALANVKLPANLIAWLPDPEGEASYPIVTYTWILCRKQNEDEAKAAALKKVLEWCLTEGQKTAPELFYIALPDNVAKKVLEALETIS